MNIIRHTQPEPRRLDDFAEAHNLTLHVHERSERQRKQFNLKRFYCYFEETSMKNSLAFEGNPFGEGDNEDLAIGDLAVQLSYQTVKIKGKESDTYIEVQTQNLTYL